MGVDSAERVVGMLNPSRAQLDGTGRGAGALTPQMVAAGLAKCTDRLGAALLQARVTGSFQYTKLETDLHARLLERAERDGWRANQKRGALQRTLEGQVRAMLRMALVDFLKPEQCPRCRGRKVVQDRSLRKEKDCPRCHGTGKLSMSSRALASELGITPPAWKKLWAKRYHGIQAWLSELYGTAEVDLNRALR